MFGKHEKGQLCREILPSHTGAKEARTLGKHSDVKILITYVFGFRMTLAFVALNRHSYLDREE
jgi:hypothetical protein